MPKGKAKSRRPASGKRSSTQVKKTSPAKPGTKSSGAPFVAEAKAVRGTISQFKKYMVKFWTSSLLVPQAPGEVIGLCAKPRNARQVLGIDIYEMQLLCHNFKANKVYELFHVFCERREEFVKFMGNFFHPKQQTTIVAQLDRIQEAINDDPEFATLVENEEQRTLKARAAELERIEAAEKAKQEAAAKELRDAENLRNFENEEQAANQVAQNAPPARKKKSRKKKPPSRGLPPAHPGSRPVSKSSARSATTSDGSRPSSRAMAQERPKMTEHSDSDGSAKRQSANGPESTLKLPVLVPQQPKSDARHRIQSRSSQSGAAAHQSPHNISGTATAGDAAKEDVVNQALLRNAFEAPDAPESNLDSYLRETEAAVNTEEEEAALAVFKADKFKTKSLKQYFVHEEVDKQTELDLNHFSLGVDETNMLYGYLEDNKEIKSVCLQGNRIGPRCAPFLAKVISKNSSITKMDLSNNCLGTSVVALAHALKDTKTLNWLSLRGNQIRGAARQFADGLQHNTSLKALDLSYNDIDDEGGYCIARALQDNKTLKELNMSWNCMGAFTGEALGQTLKWNKTILSMSLAWNNLCTEGSIGLAEGLAQNKSIQFLDLSSNRINYAAVCLFADAVSLNRTVKNVQMNNNPLGTAGTHLLFTASEVNTGLQQIGINRVSAPPHTQRIPPELHYFDTHRLSGHYILNLEVRWDHAIAELLRYRVASKQGQIFRLCLNDEPLTVDFANFLVPLEGELSFDFLSNEMIQKANMRVTEHKEAPNSVHYVLDLAKADDRDVYSSLCSQARAQAGENFVNETLNGEKFEFDEEQPKDPTERLTRGIIELDFVTTRLSHEARYQFDLRDPIQHAKATKMLERVYLSQKVGMLADVKAEEEGDTPNDGETENPDAEAPPKDEGEETKKLGTIGSTQGGGDQWTNVTVDGKKVNVHEWRVNIDSKGAFKWREDIDSKGVEDTLRATWRVPTKGILEFDLITSNPMYMFSDHYRLNLANVKDRQLAESLRVSAALQPGENWWNETLNGYRFDLQEIVSGNNNRLPSRGILEFDIVMLAPQRGNLVMKQDHYIFDLEDPVEFECVNLMRQRVMKYRLSQEEFWMHVRFNDHVIPASMVWRAMWQIPTKGVLEFDYVTFETDRRDMPRNTFKLLVIALKAVNDREKFYLLQSQDAGPDPYHMTIQQVRKVLKLFARGTIEQRMALEVLLKLIRHPHQALHLLESVSDRDKNALKYWALHSKWMT